jgi:hypothetical protein
MRGAAPRRPGAPAPLRLRSGDTRIGRLLLPGLVLLAAGYITFTVCQGFAASAFAANAGIGFARGALGTQVGAGAGGGLAAGAGGAALTRAEANAQVSTRPVKDYVGDPGTIHVMSTSNGSPYLNYQTRIMYKTFTMVRTSAHARVRQLWELGLGPCAVCAACACCMSRAGRKWVLRDGRVAAEGECACARGGAGSGARGGWRCALRRRGAQRPGTPS